MQAQRLFQRQLGKLRNIHRYSGFDGQAAHGGRYRQLRPARDGERSALRRQQHQRQRRQPREAVLNQRAYAHGQEHPLTLGRADKDGANAADAAKVRADLVVRKGGRSRTLLAADLHRAFCGALGSAVDDAACSGGHVRVVCLPQRFRRDQRVFTPAEEEVAAFAVGAHVVLRLCVVT
eukprot:6176973-Pleurochrysis_carterae.AAC.2